MNGSDFNDLLQHVMTEAKRRAADKGQDLSARMSKPRTDLLQLYGPLVDKVMKNKSANEAQRIYDLYLKGPGNLNNEFWALIRPIVAEINATSIQATNGGTTSLASIIRKYDSSFDNMQDALKELSVDQTSPIAYFLMAAGDIMFMSALSLIPVVGPAVSVAMSATVAQIASSAAAAGASALVGGVSSAVTNTPNSSAGVVSLCCRGIAALEDAYMNNVLAKGDLSGPSFAKIVQGTEQSQNQIAAGVIKTNIASSDKSKIDLFASQSSSLMPSSDNILNKQDTLDKFRKRSKTILADASALLDKLINSGVKQSFISDTVKIDLLPEHQNNDSLKAALLIIGYYFAKDWDGGRRAMADDVRGRLQAGQMSSEQAKKLFAMADRDESGNRPRVFGSMVPTNNNIGLAGQAVFDQVKTFTGKTDIKQLGFDPFHIKPGQKRDYESLRNFSVHAISYFKNLKAALVADFDTVLNNTYPGGTMSDVDYKEMWSIYIVSSLIVNDAVRDNRFKMQTGFRDFFRGATKSGGAPTVPDKYIEVLVAAGFIHRYSAFRVSTAEKQRMAALRKLRWENNPSNAERAMLIVFCIFVVYTVDISRITLGFYKWSDTKIKLGDICTTISESRYI
ncbi:hypothetical protein OPKNFCMD_3238 [Methylobacterium crusticola]|uniref:Uncharacterized protein n=1 Tax=Methylobacterium crusticola TaxID=1697972 RepID=A0ABQ4R072_9HYPH|nr:hypothetical protein [Methylobacterium crusticola]GJD50495.1 hypothetical protein OPKNFCMD_3238 [Methylobacterium crusticola]